MLAETASIIDLFDLEEGNRWERRGKKMFLRPFEIPLRRMISMTPVHRHVMPQIPIQRLTAAPAPSRAAVPTASIRPVARPKTTDTTIIIVHIHVRAISDITPKLWYK
jgi:hypothetical protein